MSEYFSRSSPTYHYDILNLVRDKLNATKIRTVLSDPEHSCRSFPFRLNWGTGEIVVSSDVLVKTEVIVRDYPDRLTILFEPSVFGVK